MPIFASKVPSGNTFLTPKGNNDRCTKYENKCVNGEQHFEFDSLKEHLKKNNEKNCGANFDLITLRTHLGIKTEEVQLKCEHFGKDDHRK